MSGEQEQLKYDRSDYLLAVLIVILHKHRKLSTEWNRHFWGSIHITQKIVILHKQGPLAANLGEHNVMEIIWRMETKYSMLMVLETPLMPEKLMVQSRMAFEINLRRAVLTSGWVKMPTLVIH